MPSDGPFLHLLEVLATGRLPLMAGYALCAAGLLIWEIRAPAKTSGRLIAFALLSLAFFVLLRAPSIFFNAPFNPDEAEMLANARKFTLDMNSWRSVDTASGAPLDSFVLMWPELFGRSPSFATARVTELVLLFSAWLALLRLPAPNSPAVRFPVLACLMLVLGGSRMNDHLHYTSEILPLSLMVFAAVLVLGMVNRPLDLRLAVLAAFLLGCIPYTKLQAAPPAVFLGLVLAWQAARSQARPIAVLRNLLVVVVAALGPTILILGPLTLSGDFDQFWNSYIIYATQYVRTGVGGAETYYTVIKNAVGPNLLVRTYFGALAVLSAVGLSFSLKAIPKPTSRAFVAFAIGAGFFAASLFAVIAPRKGFPHYGYLVLMPAAIVTILAWGFEAGAQTGRSAAGLRRWLLWAGLGSMLLVLGGATRTSRAAHSSETTNFSPTIMAPETFFGSGDLLPDLPGNRRVLVWGWMGEWYVQSAAIPATRDMITDNQIWPTPLRNFFRDRMLSDLRQSSPRFIVDAVAPGSFYYDDPAKAALSIFPALKALVDANYVQISHSPEGDACPRTYVKKSDLAQVSGRYAPVSAVTASASKSDTGRSFTPAHLLDGVLFETCTDRWLLPDHERGSVRFDLTAPSRLGSVEILNTRNGVKMDRATRAVQITGWSGTSQLWTRRVDLKRYPYWTRVAVAPEAGPVSSVTIAIDSFAGEGGGLNEVRFVRAAP